MMESSTSYSTYTDRVDNLFTRWDRLDSPGCALGIIRDGQLFYRRGYGMANLEHDIPITSRSVFRIGSTSKQFTAMCIALLVEGGQVSLEDDIRDYLPEISSFGDTITIRHLIYHTSGLRDYIELMSLAGVGDEDFYTEDELIEMLSRQKELNFAPGDKYLYSNTGYFLLSAIVKRVSGKSLRLYAEDYIFKPLGMRNTHFHDDHKEIVKHLSTGYSPRDGGGFYIDMTTLDIVGDGGVYTTVEDLYLWDQNFYSNILGNGGNDLIHLVQTPGRLNNGDVLNYAFGLELGEYRGLKTIGHGGGYVGYRSEVIRFPEQAFSVICLANLSTFDPGYIVRRVADIYLDECFQEEAKIFGSGNKTFTQPTPRKLKEKAGIYSSPSSGAIIEFFVEDEKLKIEAMGYTLPFVAMSETSFQAMDAPFRVAVTFEKDELEKPWRVYLFVEDEKPEVFESVEVVSPGANQLTEYEGSYYSGELNVSYALLLEGEEIYIQRRNAPKNPLRAGPSDVFWVGEMTFLFSRDHNGQVNGFQLNTGRVKNIRFTKNGERV